MRNLFIVNTAVFTSVAALHVLRLMYQAPVSIGAITIELWLSAVATVGTLVLAWLNWKQVKKHTKNDWLLLLLALIVVDAFIILYMWIADITFWGVSGNTWLWFVLLDVSLVALIHGAIRNRA